VTCLRLATNRKTLVIAALLAIATALAWGSWRVGSPLMTAIRNTDVELELRNEIEAPSSSPIYKSP
jgi:hypothetical protein